MGLDSLAADLIDVVKDMLYGADYVKGEDPKYYHSDKSGRGPLSENWLEEYWDEVQGKEMPLPNGKSIMCAYKLCKVEFRYWGMQTKIEKFIHDIGEFSILFHTFSFATIIHLHIYNNVIMQIQNNILIRNIF